MKKFAYISFILVFICVLFVGCGKDKTQIQKAQDKIVEIGEQFLDYELTADEAQEKLESIIIPESEIYENAKLYLECDRDSLVYYIVEAKSGIGDYKSIKEKLNSIKKCNYEE